MMVPQMMQQNAMGDEMAKQFNAMNMNQQQVSACCD
jgi:hypothetical protein